MSDRKYPTLFRWMYPLRWRWKSLRRLCRRRFWWILLLTCFFLLIYFRLWDDDAKNAFLDEESPIRVHATVHAPSGYRKNCSHFNCFDVYRCNALDNGQLSVHVSSLVEFYSRGKTFDLGLSGTFRQIRKIVRIGRFYARRREDACVFIPSIDLLTPNSSQFASRFLALAATPGWNGGKNNLVFALRPRDDQNDPLQIGAAMIASPGFFLHTYRRGFDIAIPVPVFTDHLSLPASQPTRSRSLRLILTVFIPAGEVVSYQPIAESHPDKVLIVPVCRGSVDQPVHKCSNPSAPLDFSVSRFCFAVLPFTTFLLGSMLSAGCIPVIPSDFNIVLPFDEVLDWSRSTIALNLPISADSIAYLQNVPFDRIAAMQRNGRYFWERFFSSWSVIVDASLQVINDRIFPKTTSAFVDWNIRRDNDAVPRPIFLPGLLPTSLGFTAVILTFDRPDSLFELITLLGQCRSLSKILVIWNNHDKLPPAGEKWPSISQPVQVLKMPINSLNNRFVPYSDIETEAVFSLDDDILMLTPDEIELGFQVWLENSDRLVGFPSRLHVRNSSSHLWEYNSEWGSSLSVVLTGAAFFSKTYSQYYTQAVPRVVHDYVDQHVNCEDLALNFLITNLTGKGPIKVGPRKKFRCPKCSNVDMLSSDSSHLWERSQCINYFVSVFGRMPLVTVEYRADAVLYKADVAKEEAKYPDIGAL